MSILSGSMGAVMGSNAQTESTHSASDTAGGNAMLQLMIHDQQRADFKPYMDTGYEGLGQMKDFDLMQGVGDQPSYDAEYTQKLGDYKQSEGFTAQNSLGQQALQRQLNARGLNYGATGASAGAELTQKLTATDYDKYRQDLGQRYTALQGEYANRRDVNQNKYSQLLDKVKIGQGAANSAGQAGTQYAQQAGQAFSNLSNAQMAGGQAQAGMFSGLGAAASNTAATGLKAYDMGSKLGWFGAGAVPAAGGYAAGVAGSVGPPTALEAAALLA